MLYKVIQTKLLQEPVLAQCAPLMPERKRFFFSIEAFPNENDKQVDLMVEIFKKLVEFCVSPENLCDVLLLEHCISILPHANQPDYDFV